MKDENYPQEITADEKRLGFELLGLESYGLLHETIPPLSDARVVVKRLSPSDVLVKILFSGEIAYSHKKFGKDVAYIRHPEDARCEWWPIFAPCPDAKFAIARFEAGSKGAAFVNVIIPFQFKFTPA
ncbi:MAG TPA: hypothetical protein VN784_15570 [Candidatus Limnocylindrales bacterium]|nr:hypothetical protein [Candidatus Limnocylindrales bacterium]